MSHRFHSCLGLILLCAGLAPSLHADTRNYVHGQLVCRMQQYGDIDSIDQHYGTTTKLSLTETASYLLLVPDSLNPETLATEIESRSDVSYCSLNYYLDAPEAAQSSQPFLDVSSGVGLKTQKAVVPLQVAAAQALASGTSVTVAVIDVGVDLNHPTLTGVVESGYDFIDEGAVAQDRPGGKASGHGTFIAGVIHLVAPEARIRAYRVLDSTGRGDGFTIARAVLKAVSDGCKVINLSCVMRGEQPSLDLALEYAQQHGVTIIAAAGNDSTEADVFPASSSHVMAVAALDSTGRKAGFSNFGEHISVCAPGTGINAEFPDSSFAFWSGTSFAAPFVAAEAALIYSVNPNLPTDEVRSIIRSSATNVDSLNPEFASQLGSGEINILAAVLQAQQHCCIGTRGNINGTGGIDLGDLSLLVTYLTSAGGTVVLSCPYAANVDGVGTIDLGDVTLLTNYLAGNGVVLPSCP